MTNAVCSRRKRLATGRKFERDIHNDLVYALGAGTYAQPKQASQSKYNG